MKVINNTIIVILLILSLLSVNYLFIIGLLPLLFIALLIRKYNKNLELIYLLFLFIAYVLGYGYDYYDRIYYFDVVAHSFFGVFASIFALPLLKKTKRYDSKNKIFNIIFIIIFTLSMAVLWEITEFTIDKIFITTNMQKGLNNTMKDIISAFLFSILYSLIYFEKTNLIEKLFITKN